MNDLPLLSVILCSRNGEADIESALESLLDQSLPPNRFEVIVVDNGSTDRTAEIVRGFIDRRPSLVRMVSEPGAGLSRARNRGIRSARADLLAFFDDDARAEPQWLESLLPGFEDESVGAAGGPIIPQWNTPPPSWWEPDLDHLQSRLDHGPSRRLLTYPLVLYGSNIVIRRTVLGQTGLFREEMGRKGNNMAGGAEIELQLRILKHGYKLIYEPSARIHHLAVERRTGVNYLRRKAYWHGRSQARCEIITSFQPSKPVPQLPMILAKGALGCLLRHHLSLTSQYYLIFNLGYSIEIISRLLRQQTFGPPPRLEAPD